MAGPLVFLIPAGLLLLVGGAAAASKKKEKEQAAAGAAAGAAANAAASTVTPGPGTTGAVASTTPSVKPPPAATGAGGVVAPVSLPGAGVAAQPAQDIQNMILAALQSGNPQTMLRVAAAIEATYPQQAAELRQAAANIQAVIAAQTAAAGTTPATAATPAATPAAAAPAAATSAGQPTAAAPAPLPSVAMPTPAPSAPSAAADPNRARAGALVLALKTAKKGTASEPKALVKEFQLIERLPRQDGSYGSETALAIADRYNMVPPKPLYWGKKGGDYATLTADKNQYSAHLLNLAAKDPQRADEWRSAAKV